MKCKICKQDREDHLLGMKFCVKENGEPLEKVFENNRFVPEDALAVNEDNAKGVQK